ncbi:MAG: dephospho-CoA kinase [Pseudomonadota bacterium]|jgi:dephospho-CoA kinase
MSRLAPDAAIGLTGGIGSGKSTVAALLVELGAHLVDTDAIARSLTAPGGGAMAAVAQVFGPDFVAPDGALDRSRMRERAFADPGAKAQLEALLHPLIGAEALRQAALAGDLPVVFDVPLLTPASAWRARVARILVVDCAQATQARRVAQRPGWSQALAETVIAQQLPRAQRRALADAVIHNDGISLDALRDEVQALWRLWFGVEPG